MSKFQSDVSRIHFPRALGRRMAGLMFGALVLGSTFAGQALAQPGPRHDGAYDGRDHRVHPGDRDRRGHQDRHGSDRHLVDRHADRHVDRHVDRHPDRHVMPAPSRSFHAPRHAPPPRYHEPSRLIVHPQYRFRDSDRHYLQRHYHPSLRSVRLDRRPHFAPGHAIPAVYRSQVTVLPPHLRHRLPPPPRGYQVGYYQGYSVVYDPVSFTILSVLDLLTR